ncbi:alpha-amylase family glycosyl hydrolase [Lacticigenium naphthae]|uniref:alpha-amylase family glycosyl hydrolase n=1 Tax=Lacticigenium naphthae TaxID=515351 RepID=UPI00146A9DAD|nr:alpha-amylase family glycosyl hydrolase [Lacticigenium naphthae]
MSTLLLLASCSSPETKQESFDPFEQESFTLSPTEGTIRDHFVITVEKKLLNDTVEEISIDAQELGIEEPYIMDLELNQFSLAVSDTIGPGEKTITLTVLDTAGDSISYSDSVLITESDNQQMDDFDWDEAVIYFALTDRFHDGNSTNNDPQNIGYDPSHLETYHGGDFQGLIDKMEYLKELGVNTLWITPIVDNIDWNLRGQVGDDQYGYHGYWAKNFTQLDEHLGDIETFKRLIDTAHDHGIKLMVDVVLNHSGYGLKEIDQNPAIENFPTEKEQQRFAGMLRLNPIVDHPIEGELSGLPDFRTEDPAVRQQLIEWQSDWIERTRTTSGNTIDYFRVDTVKHVEDTTWKAFKNMLVSIQPDFKILGEYYGASLNDTGGYLLDGEMDSLLDFEFKHLAAQFINWDVEGVNEELIRRNETIDSTHTFAQFLSSHDEDGFLYRYAGHDESKLKVAASLQLTAKGQPVIYYGEEIGQTGAAAGNMDEGEYGENRYDFDWDKIETNDLLDHYKQLLSIRKKHSLVFAKGNRSTVLGSNDEGYVVFSREFEGEKVVVALNTRENAKKISIPLPENTSGKWTDSYSNISYSSDKVGAIEFLLPGRQDGGTAILVNEE